MRLRWKHALAGGMLALLVVPANLGCEDALSWASDRLDRWSDRLDDLADAWDDDDDDCCHWVDEVVDDVHDWFD